MRQALFLALVLTGCATGEAAKCRSLRGELRTATSTCDSCLSGLGVHGEADACSAYCEQPGKVAPLALNHCATAAREQAAVAKVAAPE